MKKSLLALALAGGFALLITPKFIGDSVINKVEQTVENFNDQPGYNVTISNHQTSWFNSQTTINVGFGYTTSPGYN